MSARSFRTAPLFAVLATLAQAATPAVNFDRQIRPILSDNCFTCHGPDEKHRMAALHFDTKEGAFSKTGVIIPGDSANSRMYLRISNPNVAVRMPPTYSGRKLTAEQVQLIKTWIDEGAKWETHWAFVPPKRPDPPEVKDKDWAKTPIDQFVLAKLESQGLQPSAPADKSTLLRRVTFDLTGLPPTPAELNAFLEDKSPNAYEKVVDRLLASPHYGERMTMQWMDFARYSDTHGYHIDSARIMWPWRDWVIKAFNDNMPYDEFTIEQIAGDLLPKPTQSQIIATGFNRNHMINFEGGAIPAEYQNEYMVDRIEATATTWLGITLGCARCHDHKYDPLRQKDFYSFGAFFNNVAEVGLDGYKGNAVPFLQLPSAKQTAIKNQLLDMIRRNDEEIKRAEAAWEPEQLRVPVMDSSAGLIQEVKFDGSAAPAKLVSGNLQFKPGRLAQAADLDEEPRLSLGDIGSFGANQPFTISMWLKPDGPSGMTVLQHYDGSPKSSAGYEIAVDYCEKPGCNVIVRLRSGTTDTGIEVHSKQGLELSQWNHLAVAYDGSASARGIQIFIDGRDVPISVVLDKLDPKASFQRGESQIGNKDWGTPFKGQLEDIRFYKRRLYEQDALHLGLLAPLQSVLEIPAAQRSEDQNQWVRSYFLEEGGNPAEKQAGKDLATLKRGVEQLDREIPSAMVMAEAETCKPSGSMEPKGEAKLILGKSDQVTNEYCAVSLQPRETFVLGRGDYRNKGEKVEPNAPAVLPPLPKDAPRNRLTLARWLVDPANPLTARVAVNHFWQMYFGLGIVKTSEDFGSQGDPPSNQELLDWLATEFVRTKWDLKAMQRLIVTSAVYQQSSAVTPELLEKDPENRLLARGPRFRLPAEMVRDNALAISGLIDNRIGGPSVSPYQPKGLWEEMAFGGDFSAQTYEQSHGGDLYRRSMYTFVKRTVPYPSLNTFDAPDREKCTARRGVTNTPLQALVLMNDPTYVEASRVLAERDLKEGGGNDDQRIRYAFRLATDRDPSSRELEILDNLYKKESVHYSDNKKEAEELLSIGESKCDSSKDPAKLAALTIVMSTILNLDETITKN